VRRLTGKRLRQFLPGIRTKNRASNLGPRMMVALIAIVIIAAVTLLGGNLNSLFN
jgi:hypothetical protein